MDKTSYLIAYNLASKLFSKTFTHIRRGRNNWVFESEGCVLTTPRHERVNSYKIRVKSTQLLASRGIPVADVLEYSPETNSNPEYLIVRKINGENINLSTLTAKDRLSIHQSSGEVLKSIHSLTCSGYGRLNENL